MKSDPTSKKAKSKLAEVYEQTGQLHEALQLVMEGKVLLRLSRGVTGLNQGLLVVMQEHPAPPEAVRRPRGRASAKEPAVGAADSDGEESSASRSPNTLKGSLFDESRPAPKKGRRRNGHGMTREQLIQFEKDREQIVVSTFARLEACEEAMVLGDRNAIVVWLADAAKLTEGFRVTKPLFMSDRVSDEFGWIFNGRC